jgi:hypothetical protein
LMWQAVQFWDHLRWSMVPFITLYSASTILPLSLHHANTLLFNILHVSTCKNHKRQRSEVHSTACTWWLTDVTWFGQMWG